MIWDNPELTALIKRISSEQVRALQKNLDGDSTRELIHQLGALRDIQVLLLLWNTGKSEVDDRTARSYAESAYYIAERVRELVAARVER